MDENKKIELQTKLINIIYHDIDGYGSIKDTYDKARMIDPTLEYDTVKKWYAKNLFKNIIINIIILLLQTNLNRSMKST